MATIPVTNPSDSGAGSLRQAVTDANDEMRFPGPDVIVFDGSLSGSRIDLISGQFNIRGDLTIIGPGAGALTIDGNGSDIFQIPGGVTGIALMLAGVTLTDGDEAIQINGSGNVLTLTGLRVADERGDGLRIEGDENTVTILNSVFEGSKGDNIDVAGPNAGNPNPGPEDIAERNIIEIVNTTIRLAVEDGVAISGHHNTLTVQNSTVSENGIEQNDGIDINGNDNAINLRQITISHNGEHGLDVEGSDNIASVQHSTVAFNAHQGLVLQDAAKTSLMFVDHTIAYNNGQNADPVDRADVIDYDPVRQDFNRDLPSRFISGGYNIIGRLDAPPAFGSPGDQLDPTGNSLRVLSSTLRDNGGPTPTHALLPGSPAINAGDPTFAPPPEFDQRGPGFPRIQGGWIDIGAVESAVGGALVLEPIFIEPPIIRPNPLAGFETSLLDPILSQIPNELLRIFDQADFTLIG